MKNIAKYNSYKLGFKILSQAVTSQDLLTSIASIAITESIIADRCYSYLNFKDKNFILKEQNQYNYIATSKMLKKIEKYFMSYSIEIKQKNGSILKSDNLFIDTQNWLKDRNTILHKFTKSKPGTPTLDINAFQLLANQTSSEGYKYASLIRKWHKVELAKSQKTLRKK